MDLCYFWLLLVSFVFFSSPSPVCFFIFCGACVWQGVWLASPAVVVEAHLFPLSSSPDDKSPVFLSTALPDHSVSFGAMCHF